MEHSKIISLQLQNFGPFYGNHQLDFPDDRNGVHIIRGNTGQGKTSLQKAFLWCLYGKVDDRNGQEIPLTSLINRIAVRENDFKFAVKICFKHEKKEWSLTRKTHAICHKNSKYEHGMECYLVKDNEPFTTKLKKSQEAIERILPFNVSRFFFFDGEMLVKYEELLNQNSHSMRVLKNSIEHILGIPFLRTARDDLLAIRDEKQREITRILKRIGRSDYTELAHCYEAVSEEITRKKEVIKSIQNQIDNLEDELITLKHDETEIREIRELALERQKIDEELKGLESEREVLKIKLKTLNSNLYKSVLMPITQNIIDQLLLKSERTMNKFKERTKMEERAKNLQKAIDSQICRLCKHVLNPQKLKQFEKDLVETRIKIESLKEIPQPNLIFETSARNLQKIKNQLINPKDYLRIEQEQFKLEHKIASKISYRSKISEQLRDVDSDEPFRLEVQIDNATEELGRLKGEKLTIEKELEIDLQDQRKINNELESINRAEFDAIKAMKQYVERIAEIFEASISIYRDRRRKEVETKATEIFQQIRAKQDFAKLEINQNFGLSIVTRDGTILNKAEWRSAGEEQLVALALIGALNSSAHIEAPVFMDTPFGRLDTKHGQQVLEYLPKMSDQVAIFVTDREFRKEDEENLGNNILSDHTVIHKGEEFGSFIFDTSMLGD